MKCHFRELPCIIAEVTSLIRYTVVRFLVVAHVLASQSASAEEAENEELWMDEWYFLLKMWYKLRLLTFIT